ncbi:MAG: Mrp/NBP35 family ATP-binding protein [Gemmatimonadota bacterium]|nr:Mrp/NBP35 family ATP-binding protein [Gemmatimonadota bacterium]MDH5805521.1 Mrp/NBP35 family ATP-binding protein [Gemmatimonadota bacterium]
MGNKVEALVAGALTNVKNPRVDNDVISAGMVEDLQISEDGVVSFTFLLGRGDPATLVREARTAVREVEGVSEVKVKVREPESAPPQGSRPQQQAAPQAPPPPPQIPNLGHVVAVSSGKGGVGKSTVSANLAVALAKMGLKVGIMDADIYGPNIPRMFGRDEAPPVKNNRIIPLEAHGVKLMSLGFMIERDAPAIWRGPIIMKVVQQFLNDVEWGQLDYLIVDLPPGTGDAQLSLVQSVKVKTSIIVTTPQEVAIGDALRGAKMFEKVGVPVLGVVENMSYLILPDGKKMEVFSSGGGEKLSKELGVPLLGQIPLQAGMTELADGGNPVVVGAPDSDAAKAIEDIAKGVKKKVGGKSVSLPVV